MAKLQIQISDQVNDILNQLLRKSDRALFIELAVKKAFTDKKTRELFTWIESEKEIRTTTQEASSTKKKQAGSRKKVKFDDEFK